MSLAIATNRRPRKIALGAATVLLHLLVLDWFSGQLGREHEQAARRGPRKVAAELVAAELIDAPAQPQAQPGPPAPPRPALEPPPLPKLPLDPVEVAEAGDAPAPPNADAAGQGSAAIAAADVQSPPAAPQTQPAAPQTPAAAPPAEPAAPKSAPEARRYKVDLPPAADILMDVARVDANGTRWSGEALLSWTLTPSSYTIRVEAGIAIVFAHVNLLTLTSEGAIGDEGFMPDLMTEKRRGRSMTATHFNRKDGRLTFSASQANYPLAWGMQDKASVPLQLAAIARADPQQLAGNIDIVVGEDRDASVFSFTVLGQEQIDTAMGQIATWHLTRPPKPGSYNSRLDLWLAPDHGWYPVQIRNLEANGAATTQTVNKIVVKNSGS